MLRFEDDIIINIINIYHFIIVVIKMQRFEDDIIINIKNIYHLNSCNRNVSWSAKWTVTFFYLIEVWANTIIDIFFFLRVFFWKAISYFLTGGHGVDAVIVGLQILPLLLCHRWKCSIHSLTWWQVGIKYKFYLVCHGLFIAHICHHIEWLFSPTAIWI